MGTLFPEDIWEFPKMRGLRDCGVLIIRILFSEIPISRLSGTGVFFGDHQGADVV